MTGRRLPRTGRRLPHTGCPLPRTDFRATHEPALMRRGLPLPAAAAATRRRGLPGPGSLPGLGPVSAHPVVPVTVAVLDRGTPVPTLAHNVPRAIRVRRSPR
ncbi:hypothetical protein QF035_004572 [Streptomyces umbrinus]|uniref:Uncharacterized protein n=1 Tax=Streptomyces umbrinus TaxID=67370 RepID=A0ABU0STV6_9ACTN|nr:hypothetical protein [Streptomyces umbrinus]